MLRGALLSIFVTLFFLSSASISSAGGIGEGPGSCYSATAPYCSDSNTVVQMNTAAVCSTISQACAYGCQAGACNPAPNTSTANTQTYAIPGTYNFTVPSYDTLTVQMWGAGGSGASSNNTVGDLAGYAGGASSFAGTVAAGGYAGYVSSIVGSTGTGESSVNGGTGGRGNQYGVKCGLIACSGYEALPGNAPGAGGGAYVSVVSVNTGGGAGSYATRVYQAGELTPGNTAAVVVGAGGNPLFTTDNGYFWFSGRGAPGRVIITWTSQPAATCSISITPNPTTYSSSGTATLTWSATNANTSMYINNVGYLTGAGGSFTVPRTATTDYSGTAVGTGGTGTCPAMLSVTSPSAPTATITSSLGIAMNIGQSSIITATFTPASGDTVTANNIDGAGGNAAGWTGGLGANTDPTTPKQITFTPTQAGSYTFSARAQTTYFTDWATYGSVTITVAAPCTLGGATLQSGESATFYTDQVAPTGQLCSAVAQTRTCTNGVLSGSASYQYSSCTCAPIYSCSGNNVTYTNSSCSTSIAAICTAPHYCSPGVSSCVIPVPSFNTGSGTTGHLEAKPQIIRIGLSAKVYWDLSNVSSCSVTGSNGDSWTGASSGAAGKTTASIVQRTTYVLACSGLDGSAINERATVNIAPVFEEQ